MQAIATGVLMSVGHDCEPEKMAEPIWMLFGEQTRISPRNHFYLGCTLAHLVNAME